MENPSKREEIAVLCGQPCGRHRSTYILTHEARSGLGIRSQNSCVVPNGMHCHADIMLKSLIFNAVTFSMTLQ